MVELAVKFPAYKWFDFKYFKKGFIEGDPLGQRGYIILILFKIAFGVSW